MRKNRQARKYYPSIRRTMVFTALLAMLPSIAIIAFTGIHQSILEDRKAKQDNINNVNNLADFHKQITDTARQVLDILSNLPGFTSMDIKHMDEVLRSLDNKDGSFLAFSAVNTDGHVIASSGLPIGTYLGDTTHIYRALKNRRFTVGTYIKASISGDHTIQGFASPIFNNDGELTGAVACSIRLEVLEEHITTLPLMQNSIATITDRNYTRIVQYPLTEQRPLGARIDEILIDAIKASPESGSIQYICPDGVKRNYTWRGIKLYPDGEYSTNIIFARNSMDPVIASSRITIRNIVFILGSGLIGILIVSYSSNVLFGKRLSNIIAVTSLLREGILSARYDNPYDQSDLGQIGHALDLMADTVQQRSIENDAYAARLEESIKIKDSLLREVHHRVKNNLQLILSMMQLQKGSGSPAEESYRYMEQRVAVMALVHDEIYKDTDNVDMGNYAQQIISLTVRSQNTSLTVIPKLKSTSIPLCIDKAVPFGLMFNDFITWIINLEAKRITEQPAELKISMRDNNISIQTRSMAFSKHEIDSFTGHFSYAIIEALIDQLNGKLQFYNNICQIEFPV